MAPNQIRAIGFEEYNIEDECLLRLQYGVPNKFYPAKIAMYDLLLDIDSYTIQNLKCEEWESSIRTLNHAAYKVFAESLNPKFIEQLK